MIQLILLVRKTAFSLFLIALSIFAAAQTGTLKGTVKDALGNPLGGASVTLLGSSKGTLTNSEGSYSFNLTAGTQTIVASYVGLGSARQSVTIKAGETTSLDFTLKETGQEETVVILGSRALPRTQMETPAPVDVIDIKNL